MCEQCTRRTFLGSAGAFSGMTLAASGLTADAAAPRTVPQAPSRIRICAIVAGTPGRKSWCVPEEKIEAITKRLVEAEKNLGNVELVQGQASNAAEAARLLARAGPDAPVLAISASIFGLSSVMPVVFQQRRPTAVFHLPAIGGHDWCLVPRWLEEGHRITLFNTSDFGDLERALSLLRVIPLLRQSRVLVSPPFKGTPESYSPEKVKERLGVELVAIPDGRYDEVLAAVDARAAEAEAKRWIDRARQVVEPKREDVVKAARASLALERLIAESRVQALCVGTCMRWLLRGFPCLGFSRLNGRGIPAACDGDADCVLTMLIMQYAFNRAGFLGNAAGVDMARNAFHLSHCSAPLKMEGPDGPEAPYLLRRHAELRGGAVTEVHYRIGQKLTFTKMVHLDSLLVFPGQIIEVPEVPPETERGCRTELVAQVPDATKLLFNWGGGALGKSGKDYYSSLHRVAYYGDHLQSIRHLAHLMGLRYVVEG
jgi:hypothetical protein